jgi:acetyl esterase/lipase
MKLFSGDPPPRGPVGPFRPGGPGGRGEPPPMHIPGVDFPITKAQPRYRDLAYASLSPAQKLDLYFPDDTGPFPMVMMVHGGAFMFGDKADPISTAGTDALLKHGFAVANLNYRLSGEARAPAQIQDVKTAIRWLRAHAKEYNLDPEKFGAWGASAGANLVALLGTAIGIPALEGAELGNPEVSSRVQAVVDWFGPIDFLQMDSQFSGKPASQTHDASDSPESLLIGAPIQAHPDLVKMVNPITYISPKASPFLIQHGTEDNTVPMQQSQLLYTALLPAIGPEKVILTLLEGAGHGGGPQFWDPANVELVLGFLDKFVK